MSEYNGWEIWQNDQGAWFASNPDDILTVDRVHRAHFAGGLSEADMQAKIDSYLARTPRD